MNVCKLKLTVAAVFNKTGPNQRLQGFLVQTTFRVTPSKLLCRSYEGVPSILSAAVQDVLISAAFLTNGSFCRSLALNYRKVLSLTRGIPFHAFVILVRRVGIVFPYRSRLLIGSTSTARQHLTKVGDLILAKFPTPFVDGFTVFTDTVPCLTEANFFERRIDGFTPYFGGSFFSGFRRLTRLPTRVETFGHIGLTVDDAIQRTVQFGVSFGGIPTAGSFIEFLVLLATEYGAKFLTGGFTGNTVRFVVPRTEFLLTYRYYQSAGIGHIDGKFKLLVGTFLFEQALDQIIGCVVLRRVRTYCNRLSRFSAPSIRFYLFLLLHIRKY